MIASDPYLQRFVQEFTETNHGKRLFAGLDKLGSFIFRDFESGKRKPYSEQLKQQSYMSNRPTARTLGELIQSGYQYKSIKEEIRQNPIKHIRSGNDPFRAFWDIEDTVVPDTKGLYSASIIFCSWGFADKRKPGWPAR